MATPRQTAPLFSPLVGEDGLVHNPSWLEFFDRISAISAAPVITGGLLAANNLSDVANVASSRTNLGLGTGNSVNFAGLNLSGLSPSLPVGTDASKNLVSLSASALTNLIGLGPTSSPTFAGLTIGTLSGILQANFGTVGVIALGTSLKYLGFNLDTIQGIRVVDIPTFAGLKLTNLTNFQAVITGGSQNLLSTPYTGVTSLRASLGLEPTDTPTFTGLLLSGLTANRVLASNGSKNINFVPFVGANNVLHDGTPPTFSKVVEDDISLSAITTNDATTVRHGFLPTLSNVPTQFLNGQGTFTTVSSGAAAGYRSQSFSSQTSVTVTHNLNGYPLVQIIGTSNSFTIIHNSLNDFTVAFDVAASGIILYTLGAPPDPTINTQVTDYTMADSDETIVSNGALTITLLSAIGRAGRLIRVKRIFGGGYTKIATALSQTIDGQPSPLILTSQYDAVVLKSDGSNWLGF